MRVQELVAPVGAIDVTLQFNEGHWKSKRKEKDVSQVNPHVEDVPVFKDFNHKGFHFGKMKEAEVLMRFDASRLFIHNDGGTYVKSTKADKSAPHAVVSSASNLLMWANAHSRTYTHRVA